MSEFTGTLPNKFRNLRNFRKACRGDHGELMALHGVVSVDDDGVSFDYGIVDRRFKAMGFSASSLPRGVIAWFANYLEYMIKAQPTNIREAIKTAIHERICNMDDD